MLQMEPCLNWTEKLQVNGHGVDSLNDESIISAFSQFLQSPFITVQLFVSTNIHTVITANNMEKVFDFACSEIFQYLLNPVCDISFILHIHF